MRRQFKIFPQIYSSQDCVLHFFRSRKPLRIQIIGDRAILSYSRSCKVVMEGKEGDQSQAHVLSANYREVGILVSKSF